MTNEQKDLLIAYLVDAGDIDPDVEAQFLDYRGSRQEWLVSNRRSIREAHLGNGEGPSMVLGTGNKGSGSSPTASRVITFR